MTDDDISGDKRGSWTRGTCLLALILAPFVLLQWLIDAYCEKKRNVHN